MVLFAAPTPAIDSLWGTLESDDDLITTAETDLIDGRLAALDEGTSECLEWEMVRNYVFTRPAPRTPSS
ncbi:MAG: addiction module protein [Propionibacteriaceae bacterium]|jgi:hypothetical protein|nr:addiction module protein [Propionibacteriaceae bacterium]